MCIVVVVSMDELFLLFFGLLSNRKMCRSLFSQRIESSYFSKTLFYICPYIEPIATFPRCLYNSISCIGAISLKSILIFIALFAIEFSFMKFSAAHWNWKLLIRCSPCWTCRAMRCVKTPCGFKRLKRHFRRKEHLNGSEESQWESYLWTNEYSIFVPKRAITNKLQIKLGKKNVIIYFSIQFIWKFEMH